MPRLMAQARLDDEDAGALFDRADPAQEEVAGSELRFEHGPPLGRERDEQPARRLRVVAEGYERLRHALKRQMPPGEIPVARIAAGANPLPGKVEGSVDRGEAFGLEPDADATAVGHLVRVAEE